MAKLHGEEWEVWQLARYQVKPEALTTVLAAIEELVVAISARQPGTLRYEVYQEREDPTKFVHSFLFRDEKADQAHAESAEVRKFASILYPLCVKPVEFTDYRCIASAREVPSGAVPAR